MYAPRLPACSPLGAADHTISFPLLHVSRNRIHRPVARNAGTCPHHLYASALPLPAWLMGTPSPFCPLPDPSARPPFTNPPWPGHYSGYRFWCLDRDLAIPEVAAYCQANGSWRPRHPILLENGTMYTSHRSAEEYHTIIADKAQASCEFATLQSFQGFEDWRAWYTLPEGQAAPWPNWYDERFCMLRGFMQGISHLQLLHGHRLHLFLQEELQENTASVMSRIQDILGLRHADYSSQAGLAINSGTAPGIDVVMPANLERCEPDLLPETVALVVPELQRVCETLHSQFGLVDAAKWWGIPST